MRICVNPNCGEPIKNQEVKGRHRLCYGYLKMLDKERPAPNSVALAVSPEHRPSEEEAEPKIRRARAYREHQERLQDARIMAMMPLGK